MLASRIRTVIGFVVSLIATTALALRYSSDSVGCPAGGWDCGSHLAVINALLRGDIFPVIETAASDAGKPQLLYSGILGAHLIAAAVTQLGTGIPRAMLITLDLALLASMLIFSRVLSLTLGRQSLLSWLLFSVLFIPGYCYIASQGFFSLAVAVPFAMFAIYSILRRALWLGFGACLASTFVYPDSAFWLFPFLCIVTLTSHATRLCKFLSVAFTAVLLTPLALQLAHDMAKDGAIYINPTNFFLLPFFLLLAVVPSASSQLKKDNELPKEVLLALLALLSISCWTAVSFLAVGSLKYYAQKQYLWAPMVCCFLIPRLAAASRARILLATSAALSPLWLLSESSINVARFYSTPKAAFSARDEQRVLDILKSPPCPQFVIVGDSAGRRFNNGATFFLSANSYFASLYPDTTVVTLKSGEAFDFVPFLQNYWANRRVKSDDSKDSDATAVCIF